MKLFIAQPMTGQPVDEINMIRGIVTRAFIESLVMTNNFDSFEVIDQVNLPDPEGIENMTRREKRLTYLGRSIQLLATADIVVFVGDWENAKGCVVEHGICVDYDIPIYDIKEYMSNHRYKGDQYELVFPELGEYKELDISPNIYPCIIITDRYTGTYSGGEYTAWPCCFDEIPDGIFEDDVTCGSTWGELKTLRTQGRTLFGVGNTPNEALLDLLDADNKIEKRYKRYLLNNNKGGMNVDKHKLDKRDR